MYEAQTYEAILSRMLQKALSINGNLDTREGSLVWCGDAPAAVELQNLYIALDTVLNETFADTATRPYLILRAAERGWGVRRSGICGIWRNRCKLGGCRIRRTWARNGACIRRLPP